MNDIDYVRAEGNRLRIQFESAQATLWTSPTRWADWVRRFWWTVVGSLALSWVGFLAHQAGAPRGFAIACATPVGALFAFFVAYVILSVLYAVVTLGFGKPVLSRFGAWTDRRRTPAAMVGSIPVGSVANVSPERKFRRTAIHVTFTDGHSTTYTRWGSRHIGRVLTEGLRGLASQPLR